MTRTALYVRVSTEEQRIHGYSIQAQKQALYAFCEANGLDIVGEYNDEGISARKSYKKRPALVSLLGAVERGEVDLILFCKLDRWFRSIKDYYEVQKVLDARCVPWRAILEDYETVTAGGRFKVNIMLAVAENEADRTSERIKFVFDDKRKRGELVTGAAPIGLKREGKKLAIDESTAPAVVSCFNHYLNTRNVASTQRMLLNEYGIDKGRVSIKYILRNQHYVAEGLVTADMFDAVQRILGEREPRHSEKNVFIFSGLIKCPECGRTMGGMKDADGRYYYRRSDRRCANHRYIPERKVEEWLVDHLAEEVDKHNNEANIGAEQREVVDKSKIKARLDKLTDLYLNDLIDRERYEREYRELQSKLKTAPAPQAIDTAFLIDFRKVYGELDREHRQAFWHRLIDRIEPSEDGFKLALNYTYR